MEFNFSFSLSPHQSCHSDTILNSFWACVTPILSFPYHFQRFLGFHHTYFVVKVPFSTRFGPSPDPFHHSDTIFNPFRAFITPTLSLRYHFQPMLGLPFSTHLELIITKLQIICNLDTIFNPFWLFVVSILRFRYRFKPILAFRHTSFLIQIPFSIRKMGYSPVFLPKKKVGVDSEVNSLFVLQVLTRGEISGR